MAVSRHRIRKTEDSGIWGVMVMIYYSNWYLDTGVLPQLEGLGSPLAIGCLSDMMLMISLSGALVRNNLELRTCRPDHLNLAYQP